MIIISMGFCGISARKGTLFGEGKYPIRVLRFLVVSVYLLSGKEQEGWFRSAAEGLSHDPAWLIENHGSVRTERKRARARIRAQMESEYRSLIEYYAKQIGELDSRNVGLQREVYALKAAIKSLGADNCKSEAAQ